jgi:hypothetical protein
VLALALTAAAAFEPMDDAARGEVVAAVCDEPHIFPMPSR